MKAQGYTKETIADLGIKKTKFPAFREGDTIAVHQRIKEGSKERVQIFQGDVIAVHQGGASGSFTVRKIGAHNVPVERIIPFNSPMIKEIKLVKTGDVRRAKLYYVRDRIGKAGRFKEKVITREQREQQAHDKEIAQNDNDEPPATPPTSNKQPPLKAAQ